MSGSTFSIEPYLARRDALTYLERFSNVKHPFTTAEMSDKNDCAGVVAYTAYIVGLARRGVPDEGRVVLEGLMKRFCAE
jgi:hypothetical protein